MKRFPQIILVLLVIGMLAACAGDSTPAEEPTPEAADSVSEEQVEVPGEEPSEENDETIVEEAPSEQTEEPIEPAAEEPSETTGEAGAEGSVEEVSANVPLVGTVWNLGTLNGHALIPETSITAEFSEDGQVGGSAGCNRYFAAYAVDGDDISLNVSPAAMTMMACPDPVMFQETEYLATLEQVKTFSISGNQLMLYDAAGNSIAVYSAVSQDLLGSMWEVISYNNGKEAVVSVIIETQITANFSEDGELTGNSGCNQYFSSYEADGNNISIGQIEMTEMACMEPEGVMEQEMQYLAALKTAVTYKIDGDQMNMRTAEGSTVANFQRATAQDGEASDAHGEFALSPTQIRLDTQGLPYSWQPVVVEGTPYDQSMPPGPVGLPAHIQILFGVTDPADRQFNDPIMYIIPVNPYRKLWEDAGNDSVTRMIQSIQDLNFNLTTDQTSGYPALPWEEIHGANDLAVQVAKAVSQVELNNSSATQDGYRFVGRWAQDANPVTNQNLRYTYQGFTNDGAYLVALWWPARSSTLSDDGSDFTQEQWDAFYADPTAATNQAADELNKTTADQWDPDLSQLDAMVASLQIEGMVTSGLVDTVWEWTAGPAQPGSSENVTLEDPTKYQVIYESDGTMVITADCNSGSMTYELTNAGMAGSMLVTPGPVTLAECGAESLSNAFIASLQAAQDYQVLAGGNGMNLVLPAGGGVLNFRNADDPRTTTAEGATVSGMVTNIDNAAIAEGAKLSVQIQDTSLADAPAKVIGEQIIENPAQFPIAYQVAYDPNDIIGNHTYTMSTRIEAVDGSLLFINDTAIQVITNDNPTEDVEIPVIQTGG